MDEWMNWWIRDLRLEILLYFRKCYILEVRVIRVFSDSGVSFSNLIANALNFAQNQDWNEISVAFRILHAPNWTYDSTNDGLKSILENIK